MPPFTADPFKTQELPWRATPISCPCRCFVRKLRVTSSQGSTCVVRKEVYKNLLCACSFHPARLCPESLALGFTWAAQSLLNFPGYLKWWALIVFTWFREMLLMDWSLILVMIGPNVLNSKINKSRHVLIHIFLLQCMPVTDIGMQGAINTPHLARITQKWSLTTYMNIPGSWSLLITDENPSKIYFLSYKTTLNTFRLFLKNQNRCSEHPCMECAV